MASNNDSQNVQPNTFDHSLENSWTAQTKTEDYPALPTN